MKSTNHYIKLWQKALKAEIMHLKKYGSTKYSLTNGQFIGNDGSMFTYYFETEGYFRIPVGAMVRIEPVTVTGTVLSSEGKSVIISLNEKLVPNVTGLFLLHDPWELLDELHERLYEILSNKRKRARIKRLMNPPNEANHPLDNIKSNVHELVLRSKYNPVTFVWGPPGTGKTYTLARVAGNKYIKGQNVLVLAQSNQAVDVLMTEIVRFVGKKGRFNEGEIVRYGSQSTIVSGWTLSTDELIQKRDPDLAEKRISLQEERRLIKLDLGRSFSQRDSERLLRIEAKLVNILEKFRKQEMQLVRDAVMIGTTLSKAATDPAIYEKDYDIVLIDEASMAYVPQIAFAASLGKRIIICGDFKQLPPIASAKNALVYEWLKQDIFHKSGVVDSFNERKSLHPNLFLLSEQRRMHPDISSFTNNYIYESLVGDHPSVKTSRNAIVERAPFVNRSSILVDTSFTGHHCLREKSTHSRFNLWQLFLSFQLIHESYLAGTKSIGYVTPYRAQAALMDILLTDIYTKECQEADIISATVHRLQGSERDVILFDSVDSYPQEQPGMLIVGKDSERLINVAITRTKGKFIHICDQQFIRSNIYRNKMIRKLVDHQFQMNQEVLPHQIGTWIKHQHPKLMWMHAKKLEQLKKDIQSANCSIYIGLPSGKELNQEWLTIMRDRHRQVQLILMTKTENRQSFADQVYDSSISFPFIIIDNQYLWLGLPIDASVGIRPPFVAARLSSTAVIDYFLRQLIEYP
ncbi:DNA helicase [Bacillus sp. SA1-12]|uniref:AAA domain-containing protein n=1 Tax=Bacillus sp. SA1-12 TaxID=1455638 RepID=UPI000627205B|nr:AAA domain-containing protein [Bacillus sp. SA1-12]KKI90256.1 DNA helicase [Bacillus sp. SA1-12]